MRKHKILNDNWDRLKMLTGLPEEIDYTNKDPVCNCVWMAGMMNGNKAEPTAAENCPLCIGIGTKPIPWSELR